ncbi:mandelate racemase/muconate lactonizing enzyme family protein [Pigmentiphaga soli]|uniref:Mandelate racemase/muconate lactonizing enzyme family protein n=1 Tax=Pigmentiphaga soli TaxID=1007095 RepID=A0ABP8GF76_9BURK
MDFNHTTTDANPDAKPDMRGLFNDAVFIAEARIFVYLAPLSPPMRASFGMVAERSTILVSLTDDSGHTGWGEVWSAMPSYGAAHRALLLERIAAPAIVGQTFDDPTAFCARLEHALLPVQRLAGEPGPVAQVVAGLDCALWDLAARRQRKPLYELLGGRNRKIPIYASGVRPDIDGLQLDRLRSLGFRAFKLKAGFDDEVTIPQIIEFARGLGADELAMIDANCGWTPQTALKAIGQLSAVTLGWIEEPIGPERSRDEWLQLSRASASPLAGGENLLSLADFQACAEWLDVIQPDLGKWGGVTGILPLALQLQAKGRRYCPHAFGSNVGGALAAHLLLAAGDGILEIDVTQNLVRNSSSPPFLTIGAGTAAISDAPGIGIEVDLDALEPYLQSASVVR